MPAVDDPIGRYVGEPWDQQPNEPVLQYSRFLAFAERKPKDRNLSALADEYGVTRQTLQEYAQRWRWRERAALRDAQKAKEAYEAVAEKRQQVIERVANIALASTSILARSIRVIAESNVALDPKDLPAWAKMIETYQKITADNPEQVIALTGPGGGPIQVEEFKGLTPEQIRDRAGEMARSVLRVIEGGKNTRAS
jgi:hypothetical protein